MKLSRLGMSLAVVALSGGVAFGQALAPVTADGSQEVPSNNSTATGTAQLAYDASTMTLSWHITHDVAGATAAHFHGPAAPGVNAGVQVNVGPASPNIGSQVLTAQQESDLLAGLWYLNIHSGTFPGGEIRAQLSGESISVVINEVQYDGVGSDNGQTFVELHGPAGTDITNWRVRGIEAGSSTSCGQVNGSEDHALIGSLGPDSLFVLADDDGTGGTLVVVDPGHNGGAPDQIVGDIDPENGTDAIQLVHPSGVVIDAVTYGDGALCTVDVNGDKIVEGNPAFDVFGGFSIERWPAGDDTDDNKIDFTPQCSPSAGSASQEPRAFFFNGSTTISGAAGGSLDMDIHTGRTNMGQYIVFAFATPPATKTTLGLPFDPITNLFIVLATSGSPLVTGFVGNLDACGEGTASLTVPPGTPIGAPVSLFFVGATVPINGGSIATNFIQLDITP